MVLIKVQIMQHAIPAYRVALYQGLLQISDLDVYIYASKNEPGGLESVPLSHPSPRINTGLETKAYFDRRLFWQAPVALRDDLKRGDVLVLYGNPRYLSNLPLIVAARRRGVAILWWGQGWTPGAKVATAAIRRAIMRYMDACLLYTDKEVEEYIDRGFARDKLFATNNSIDQTPIRAASKKWD